MRTHTGRWKPALTFGLGIAVIGTLGMGCGQSPDALAAPEPAIVAAAAVAAPKAVAHAVAKPAKGHRAKAPPAGAKPSTALRFAKGAKWKADPKTHAVFAVDGRQVWFLDPDTGWPYTIDAHGVVYTSDPLTGSVYDLGRLSAWRAPALYFFDYWDRTGGSYALTGYDTYTTLYADDSYSTYTYDDAYDEVWEENDAYFASDDFDDTMQMDVVDDSIAADDDVGEADEAGNADEEDEAGEAGEVGGADQPDDADAADEADEAGAADEADEADAADEGADADAEDADAETDDGGGGDDDGGDDGE
jgi:hypothetical protein